MAIQTDLFKPIDYRTWKTDPKGFAQKLGQSFRETGFAFGHGSEHLDLVGPLERLVDAPHDELVIKLIARVTVEGPTETAPALTP